ncbi:transposase family protein [Streptomyces sennicomposti]
MTSSRGQPGVGPGEVAGLLERLAAVPDPRDPRGVRHALAVVLALAACAVLAVATSVLAVGEWIADAPPQVLERLGVYLDPVLPRRLVPAETTVRRLLAPRPTITSLCATKTKAPCQPLGRASVRESCR